MDLETLVAPLPGLPHCGPDLMFSAEFDQLAELRRHDDATLAQGEWVSEIKRADWPAVMRLCESLLRTRTKDLRLAAWWTEAAAHAQGYAGLADGLTLYAALCRAHWDDVHPQPEDGDVELRIGSISWLLGQVGGLARSLPLLEFEEQALSLADIDAARQRPAGAAAAPGRPPLLTMDMVAKARRAMPAARMQAQLEGARRLPQALALLQTVVDEHLGDNGPGFAPLRDTVAAALASLERLAREMGLAAAEPADAASHPPQDTAADSDVPATGPGGSQGPPASRAQALAQLRLVADYFRRNEPHSPVAYLVDRAARWGEMPLHEWLRSVLKEQGTLAQIEELLGVPPAPPTA